VHRPADPVAHHDHVHALLRRPVVDVHVEHALVQIGCRVLDLPQVEPDEVGEPGVHREDPGEVVVQVDLRRRARGPRRAVHALRRGVRRCGQTVLDGDVAVLAVAHAERRAEDVRGVVVPGAVQVAGVVDRRDGRAGTWSGTQCPGAPASARVSRTSRPAQARPRCRSRTRSTGTGTG
jgi:hypothetical protein